MKKIRHILVTVLFCMIGNISAQCLDDATGGFTSYGGCTMILGAFGNSPSKASEGEALPFKSFTGYTSTLKEPSEGTLQKSNSTGAREPESPKNISASDAKKVADSSGSKNKAFTNSATGKVFHLGSGESKTVEAVNKMKTGVEGFTQELDNLKSQVDVKTAFGQDKINGLINDTPLT